MEFVYNTLGAALAIALLGVATWLTLTLRPWRHLPYVRAWVASYWWTGLGVFLYAAHAPTERGTLLLTAFRSCLLMVGAGYLWIGTLRFQGSQVRSLPTVLAPMALYLAAMARLSAYPPGRSLAFSLGCAPFVLHAAFTLLRNLPPELRRMGRFTAGVMLVHGLFHALRAVVLAVAWTQADLLLWVSLGFLEAFPVLVTMAVAQWMLVEQRVEMRPEASSR
ncbi:MAG TPA: hypothetical protein VJ570_09355 [Holophagaceae bacterium]|nr:hypothetical protein [Holophagaceae bacterium]